MEEKIKIFFDEASKGHCDLELYKELLFEGSSLVDYAVKNNRLNDLKILITPQKYDDGIVRILYDPFSDSVYSQLEIYLFQDNVEIKKLIDSLYDIDYDKLFQIKVKDSHARQISGMGHPISGERDVIFYSEPACIKSMLHLYNLNIDTWANDTGGVIEDNEPTPDKKFKCGINIYYSRLDEENKKIVDRFIKEGYVNLGISNDEIVFINVDCDREETIGEVSNRLLALVSQFKIQDVKYYQLNEQEVKDLALGLYNIKYRYKSFPYDLLAKELIEYYEQFSLEEYPEIKQAIQDVKNNVYDEEELNDYFKSEDDFRKQVIRNMLSSIPLENCIQELLENDYYIDRENNLIFDNEIQYLKHLKYLSSSQTKNNNFDNQLEDSNLSSTGHSRLSV